MVRCKQSVSSEKKVALMLRGGDGDGEYPLEKGIMDRTAISANNGR